MLRAMRRGEAFDAGAIGWVGIFPCAGGRDEEAAQRLAQALQRSAAAAWRRLPFRALHRGEPGPDDAAVWYHAPGLLARARAAGQRDRGPERSYSGVRRRRPHRLRGRRSATRSRPDARAGVQLAVPRGATRTTSTPSGARFTTKS